MRIGFIGCGAFATQAIWPSLRYAPVEIGYAYSRGLDKARAVARRFGAENATDSLDEVFADDTVRAVFVVGPAAMQHEVTLRALAAGKHVFVEKPPAPSLEQALEIQRAADLHDRQVQVGFQKRFATAYRLAREEAGKPDFGGVRLAKVNYSHWRVRDWNHHLHIMSVHAIDLIRFLLGDPAEAYVLKRSDPQGRNTCVLTLLYEDGASAIVNMSANDPHVQEWIELSGANQLISVRNLTEYRRWAEGAEVAQTLPVNPAAVTLWHPEYAIPYQQADSLWLQGYAGEVVDFVEAVQTGRPVSPSIADGVAAMRYVEAIADAPEGMSRLEQKI
ncbi:Gfo/Idh/MocA family oxidoreductase [Nonomuraea antimicrobica]|uniref:Gfo/Idh/MocA family protein n=1 Tax=Nonomuraea antimicrobica TaxID=561173 RepID=UPI0031E548C1